MCNQNPNQPVPRGAVCAENACLLSSIKYDGQIQCINWKIPNSEILNGPVPF